MLNAALNGDLNKAEYRKDENFGFEVPFAIANVDVNLLNPRKTWTDPASYDAQAQKLVSMFIENFAKFESQVTDDVKAAAPVAAW